MARLNNMFNYKPSKYGSQYEDIYTTGKGDGGGGGGGKGGGGKNRNQSERRFEGNGKGDNLKFKNGGGGGKRPDPFRTSLMIADDRDIFGMERGGGSGARGVDMVPETTEGGGAPPPPDIWGDRMRGMAGGFKNGLNLDALQKQIAGNLDPNAFEKFRDGTPYSQDEQARRMLSTGNQYGGQLTPEQQQGKALMYAMNQPGGMDAVKQAWMDQNGGKRDFFNTSLSMLNPDGTPKQDRSGPQLNVDEHGDGITLDAGKVLRQQARRDARQQLPPPPEPPRRRR